MRQGDNPNCYPHQCLLSQTLHGPLGSQRHNFGLWTIQNTPENKPFSRIPDFSCSQSGNQSAFVVWFSPLSEKM